MKSTCNWHGFGFQTHRYLHIVLKGEVRITSHDPSWRTVVYYINIDCTRDYHGKLSPLKNQCRQMWSQLTLVFGGWQCPMVPSCAVNNFNIILIVIKCLVYITSGPKVIKFFSYSYSDLYSVLGVCAPLSTTLKIEVIKILEYVLRWVGFGVRTPTS